VSIACWCASSPRSEVWSPVKVEIGMAQAWASTTR
jgi:hypothetical protein